ncbi:MAG: glycosyltransferase family A protein [Acidobacteriota bacterium]
MDAKLISVIIPCYNAGKYLTQALDSVYAQNYEPLEIVVVNDGSTDDTAEVVKAYPGVRYVYQQNQGPPVARNTGLTHSTGELIAFLDSDDLWKEGKLALQRQYLEEHPEEGCVIGRWQNFLEAGTERPEWVPEEMLSEDTVVLALQASLIRREVFEQVGGFNPQYRVADDLEWFVRLREAGVMIGFMSSVLVNRRIHESNISQDQNSVASATIHILKDHLDRQRGKTVESRPGAKS